MCSAIASRSVGQPLGEADELVELRLLLARAELRVVEVLPPPAPSTPVACSFAPARGEIQTSCQAGGIASASMRSSSAASVIRSPREST